MNYLLQLLYSFWRTLLLVIVFKSKIDSFYLMVIIVDILFKIAAIGIVIALLNQILSKAGRDEEAMMVTLAGVIIVLAIVVKMISEFFEAVKVFVSF